MQIIPAPWVLMVGLLSFAAVVLLWRASRFAIRRERSIHALSARIAIPSGSGRGLRRSSDVYGVPAPSAGEDEPEPRAPDEQERVLSNVEKLLREECGFNMWQAAALAEAGVDWHYAKRLIDAGCPHEVALDILLP